MLMHRYMAFYIGSASAAEKATNPDGGMTPERQAEGMAAWGAWMTRHADAIVDPGSPLGKTKRVSKSGVADSENALAAWVLIQADSHEAAAEIFRDHPHFTIFPGAGVEVVECLPMPGGPS
jgi:hypothetical protein